MIGLHNQKNFSTCIPKCGAVFVLKTFQILCETKQKCELLEKYLKFSDRKIKTFFVELLPNHLSTQQ